MIKSLESKRKDEINIVFNGTYMKRECKIEETTVSKFKYSESLQTDMLEQT